MNGETLREKAEKPGRLDQFWAEKLSERSITRAKIQEWIKAGLATVDKVVVRKPSYKLRGGEVLELTVPETCASASAEEGGLTVLYRDQYVAVIDKQPGLTVHPAPSCPEGTLVNRLLHHFPEMKSIPGERPGIVHRIDKDTSGLLVVALSEPVRLKLSSAFASREVRKTYLALVHGCPEKAEGTIEAPIGRDPEHKTRMAVVKGGREALSTYRVVWTSPEEQVSLAEVDIATGRTHQIRVHMAHIGHPLLGDRLYGTSPAALKRRDRLLFRLADRQMLHAWKLAFTHPETGEEMAFTCPPPKDFWRIPLYLARTLQKVGIVGLPGSGKSAVLESLSHRGWPVWSADTCVAQLYEPGADGWHMLKSRFGERFVPKQDAPVDKTALLAAMRDSDFFRRELMELLYPMVRHCLEEYLRENIHSRAAFAEIPMLLEAGWMNLGVVDLAVGVSCPERTRWERLAAKRGWSQEVIALFDSWQWPEDKKLAACRFVVDNSGALEQTQRAVADLQTKLRRERTARATSLYTWMRSQGYV